MKYKYILFDADETLFTFNNYEGLKTTLAKYQRPFDQEDFAVYLTYNKQLWNQYQNNEISAQVLQTERFKPLAKELGVDPQSLNDEFVDTMALISLPLPGVFELLSELKKHCSLSIVTNGLARMQQPRINNNKMQGWFDHVIISELVGVPKPSIEIFDYTLEQLGHPNKEEVLMVGDTIATDILGGNNAGISTCWLKHEGVKTDSDCSPTYTITEFAQLRKIILE